MAAHPATHGRHAPHPVQPPRGGGSRRLPILIGAAVAVVAVAAVAVLVLRPADRAGGVTGTASPEAFIDQLEQAAAGAGFARTVYGGAMRSERKGNQLVITAEGVPPSVCVSVGWKLVRKGLLSINGVTPVKVSAAKLSELCNQDSTAATLTWAPKSGE